MTRFALPPAFTEVTPMVHARHVESRARVTRARFFRRTIRAGLRLLGRLTMRLLHVKAHRPTLAAQPRA